MNKVLTVLLLLCGATSYSYGEAVNFKQYAFTTIPQEYSIYFDKKIDSSLIEAKSSWKETLESLDKDDRFIIQVNEKHKSIRIRKGNAISSLPHSPTIISSNENKTISIKEDKDTCCQIDLKKAQQTVSALNTQKSIEAIADVHTVEDTKKEEQTLKLAKATACSKSDTWKVDCGFIDPKADTFFKDKQKAELFKQMNGTKTDEAIKQYDSLLTWEKTQVPEKVNSAVEWVWQKNKSISSNLKELSNRYNYLFTEKSWQVYTDGEYADYMLDTGETFKGGTLEDVYAQILKRVEYLGLKACFFANNYIKIVNRRESNGDTKCIEN